MKLIYLGQELDTTVEHNLITTSEFGFKVDIKHTKESWYRVKEDTAYNCTQVHWRYDDLQEKVGIDVAFESDIHRTGFTRKVDTIESVTIELADKLYDTY